MRRAFGALMGIALICGTASAPTAWADESCPMERVPEERLRDDEADLRHLVNDERSSRGIRGLMVDARIASAARDHAHRMASEARVYHNPSYRNASRFGAAHIDEVVTNACSALDAHENLLGSQSHLGVLLTREWTDFGVGVASDRAGMLYVAVAFAQDVRGDAPLSLRLTSSNGSAGSVRTIVRRVRRPASAPTPVAGPDSDLGTSGGEAGGESAAILAGGAADLPSQEGPFGLPPTAWILGLFLVSIVGLVACGASGGEWAQQDRQIRRSGPPGGSS